MIHSALIQPDGKIVVTGHTYISLNVSSSFALARYKNDSLFSSVVTNIKVGNWSGPATWSNSQVPETNTDIELSDDIKFRRYFKYYRALM